MVSSAIVIEVGVRPEASRSCDMNIDVGIEDERIFPLKETNQSMLLVVGCSQAVSVHCRPACGM